MALWIVFIVFMIAWTIFWWPQPDSMANLLDELASRELLGKMLAVPRYERIVREILDEKDSKY